MSSKNKKEEEFYQALENILQIIPKSKSKSKSISNPIAPPITLKHSENPQDKLYQAMEKLFQQTYPKTKTIKP